MKLVLVSDGHNRQGEPTWLIRIERANTLRPGYTRDPNFCQAFVWALGIHVEVKHPLLTPRWVKEARARAREPYVPKPGDLGYLDPS